MHLEIVRTSLCHTDFIMNPPQCLSSPFPQPGPPEYMQINNNNNHATVFPQLVTNGNPSMPQPTGFITPMNTAIPTNNCSPIIERNIRSNVDYTEVSLTPPTISGSVNNSNIHGSYSVTGLSNVPSQSNPVRWKDFTTSYYSQNSASSNGGYKFTFTSPTQSQVKLSYSPSLISTTQSYSRNFAPTGCSAQWQHSLPIRIHWANAGFTNQAGKAVFTGASSGQDCIVQTSAATPVWSSQAAVPWNKPFTQKEPVASCSQVPRRPKRHSSQNWEYMCPSSKVHLTEDMIAKHMKELQIHCVPKQAVHTDTVLSEELSSRALENERAWQNFKELEEKLDLSDDELSENQTLTRSEPKLHILDDINLKRLESGIPEKLLAEMQKPKLEVVLWMPPGDKVRDLFKTHFPDTTSDDKTEETDCVDTIEETDAIDDGDAVESIDADMVFERPVQDSPDDDIMVDMADVEPMDDIIEL